MNGLSTFAWRESQLRRCLSALVFLFRVVAGQQPGRRVGPMLLAGLMLSALCPPAFAAGAPEAAQPLEPGVVQHRRLSSDPTLEYFLYVPRVRPAQVKLFVTVHGISRNAFEHATMFAPYAGQYGVVLVAPYFPPERFPDYQRLSRAGRGESSVRVLEQIVREVGQLTGADSERYSLFGYSGGAQFIHRYAMAYPERVAGIVVGAAGWYTFPDDKLRYPLGLMPNPSLPDVTFEPERFLRVPALVVVGERDNKQNGDMRDTQRVDATQGVSRLERGRRWIEAMQQAARARGYDTRYEFRTLPRSRHLFSQCMRRGGMGPVVFGFLFGPPPQADSPSP